MSTVLAQVSRRQRAIVVAVPLTVLLAASVAGCRGAGSVAAAPSASPTTASPSPTTHSIIDRSALDIRNAAAINLAIADSYHVRGTLTTRSGKQNIDLVMSGRDGHLTLTDDTGPLEMIRIGDTLYIKGTREYWRPSGAAAVKLMDGKYLKTPTSEKHFTGFNAFFDMNQFMPTQQLTKGPVNDVNGTPAIALVDPDPQSGGTLYVAAEGTPYPVRIQSASGSLVLDFNEYDLPVQITAPPSNQTVDVAKLLQAANA